MGPPPADPSLQKRVTGSNSEPLLGSRHCGKGFRASLLGPDTALGAGALSALFTGLQVSVRASLGEVRHLPWQQSQPVHSEDRGGQGPVTKERVATERSKAEAGPPCGSSGSPHAVWPWENTCPHLTLLVGEIYARMA